MSPPPPFWVGKIPEDLEWIWNNPNTIDIFAWIPNYCSIFTVITSHRGKDNNVNERENWIMKIREAMALFILKHNFLKNMTVRKEKRNSEEYIINGVKKIENMLKRIFEKVNR